MTVIGGLIERYWVCKVGIDKAVDCQEYYSMSSAKKRAIEFAKETGIDHVVIYLGWDETRLVKPVIKVTPEGKIEYIEEIF